METTISPEAQALIDAYGEQVAEKLACECEQPPHFKQSSTPTTFLNPLYYGIN